MGLVEEEVAAVKPKVQATPVSPPVQMGSIPNSPTSTTTFSSMSFSPVVDPAIQEMLNQSLQENKLSGFDYLKFISAVDESKSTGVPEDARFKMTFSTAKQLGVDKASLLKSGAHYVDVLTQNENDFNSDCAQYDKSQVQSRTDQIAKIESTIMDYNKQLAQLNVDHQTLSQELQQEKSKLESRKAAFKATLENFRGTIQSNLDKINQYLQ